MNFIHTNLPLGFGCVQCIIIQSEPGNQETPSSSVMHQTIEVFCIILY